MRNNRLDSLFDYFAITNENRRKAIHHSIAAFEAIPDSFSAVCNLQSNTFIYLSPGVASILGYPMEDFLKGGYDFFFNRIAKEEVPEKMTRLSLHSKSWSSPTFDYTKPAFMEFTGPLIHADHQYVPVRQFMVILEFEPGAGVRVFFGIWIWEKNLIKSDVKKARSAIQKKFKDLHRLIFGPDFTPGSISRKSNRLIQLKFPVYEAPLLTQKEMELLRLLSKGDSLKEVAQKMKVSYFTSESHRKHLFAKFEAKNVAELIKKASKVYWLE
jgi:DNA-binding CsgD family transcriptional regulator